MAEENNENLDMQGAQDFLNNLLETQSEETTSTEDAVVDDEKISVMDAEALEQFANLQNADEELDPKQVQKLIDFVGGNWKGMVAEDLEDDELERLTNIAIIKAGHFNYRPRKNFGIQYKKKRQKRNKMAKTSRRANR